MLELVQACLIRTTNHSSNSPSVRMLPALNDRRLDCHASPLIAGTTGSGKSVCVNSILTGYLSISIQTNCVAVVDQKGGVLGVQRHPAPATDVIMDRRKSWALCSGCCARWFALPHFENLACAIWRIQQESCYGRRKKAALYRRRYR